MRKDFHFKQFNISDENSAMKVGTDAVLLGAWTDISETNNILDVGTGSGIVATILAQRSEANIDAIDIDKGSIDDAENNFDNCPWKNRLTAIHSSLQEYVKFTSKKYDLIVSNPPFFSNSLKSPCIPGLFQSMMKN
ncbi:MAG: methyltransferase [Bacteroidales bacterium]|nr:methyltransferase [Bacteroidales bacterium]